MLLGNGDGTFQAVRTFATRYAPDSVAVGDFNGDGIPDVVVTGKDGVRVLLGNGDGTFHTSPLSYVAGNHVAGGKPASVVVGDFNGDGWTDLAVANADANNVSILLNDGIWPSAPGGGSGPLAHQRHMLLAALADVLQPRPDPMVIAPSLNRTELTLPPPAWVLDQGVPETVTDRVAGATLSPMVARSPVRALGFLGDDVVWADWPGWAV